ncbi:MAG TPA: MFS transporter [Actinophytocola sp.]|uniref:MFS transporter n=1 Tax=Actinophytocola sp. TaxID=1872138 RepID=UPI002DBBB3BA|nr:MFS transporter [Actinophytocola sp.]HEU5471930.1 MFS transporter [Actinophytocola sp.]
MSHSARLSDYRAALTTPGARAPVVTALLARLPIAMIGLSLLLYVQRQTGSFAIAGLVSAGVLAGVAVGSVGQGRLMDRLGPTRPLLVTCALFACAVVAGVLVIEARAATWVLVGLAFVIGLTQPTVGSASRALWTRLLPPGSARAAAYAYEAISMEVFFILGPALAGVLIVAPWPGTGVVAGSACMLLGGIGFALTPAVRRTRPAADPAGRGGRLLGAMSSPGMRTVALAALGFGLTIGFIEVAVPAAATRAGHAPVGGLMLALCSASSVIFGILYATRPWPRPLHLRLPMLLAGFSVLIAPLAIPDSLLGLTLLLLVTGLLITPQATAHSAALENVAPAGTVTEAFGWVITSVTFGLALGQSASGWLVEHAGIRASFLASSAAGLLVAALVWARRHTVTAQPATTPPARAALVPATA